MRSTALTRAAVVHLVSGPRQRLIPWPVRLFPPRRLAKSCESPGPLQRDARSIAEEQQAGISLQSVAMLIVNALEMGRGDCY